MPNRGERACVHGFVGYCSHCGGDLTEDDRECRTCLADVIDANLVVVLRRVSPRRSHRGRDEDAPDETTIPL